MRMPSVVHVQLGASSPRVVLMEKNPGHRAAGHTLEGPRRECGKYGANIDRKEHVRTMMVKIAWDETTAHKSWCYGPRTERANVGLTEGNLESIVEQMLVFPHSRLSMRF